MAGLDGSSIPVDLGSGVSLVAPGLHGWAEREPELLGGRAGEEPPATEALAAALSAAGMQQVHGIQISAEEVPVVGQDVRGPQDEGLMLLQVPDLGPGSQQVLLVIDEAGLATWHYPEVVPGAPAGVVEFSIRRDVATDLEAEVASDQRGLAAAIGRKLLSVLVFPVLEAGVRVVARALASRFEQASRPHRLRVFQPGHTRTAGAGDLAGGGWDAIGEGRALLFLHGTFSKSHGGFSGLPDHAIEKLWHAYGGRVLAFDHPTLSATPTENAQKLLSLIPPGRTLDVDIVSHSRGGLVARALTDAAAGIADPPVRVRSTVFVATPNSGTALADDANIRSFVDRVTTMLNRLPDGPWSVVTDTLSGLLEVVKIIAVGAVDGLPGLQAMDPSDPVLATLGRTGDPAMPRYAIDAEFEPSGKLLSLVRAPDAAADLVFGLAPNDLVVPTEGAAGGAGLPGFPIPAERRLSFGRSNRVWHCSYFSQPETVERLLAWCSPDEQG